MSYTPNNLNEFVSAYSGALIGMGVVNRPVPGTSMAALQEISQVAFAFAQEFDTQMPRA
jgi:hypothetical protein